MRTVGMVVRKHKHRKSLFSNLKAPTCEIKRRDIANLKFTSLITNILYYLLSIHLAAGDRWGHLKESEEPQYDPVKIL